MFAWLEMNLGGLLQLIVMSVTVIAVFFGMKSEVRVLRHDVRSIEKTLEQLTESLKQLGSILTQIAVQDARLSMIERSVEELRHGQGYIKG